MAEIKIISIQYVVFITDRKKNSSENGGYYWYFKYINVSTLFTVGDVRNLKRN
jgi:hypothetical protein